MPIRLAILVSHPIQHFAPWHRELAQVADIDLKVYFCCDWGLRSYVDPEFKIPVEWDIPLVDGYAHEFLPIARRPKRLSFWEVDNPSVGAALDRFQPDVVKTFGYAYRTNWRAAQWARQRRRPLLLYSDSSGQNIVPWWKRFVKDILLRKFYSYVDGALFVGDNNRRYHRRYGLPPDRLFLGVLPVDRRMMLKAVPDPASTRGEVRSRLGIPGDAFVVLFCGKYIESQETCGSGPRCASARAQRSPGLGADGGRRRTTASDRVLLQNREGQQRVAHRLCQSINDPAVLCRSGYIGYHIRIGPPPLSRE